MPASKWFIYPDQESAGGMGNRFHTDDRCIVVASWTGIPKIKGYDPGKWRTAYDQARAEVTADGYKLSDRNILQRMRDMIPTMFSDGPQVPSILRDPGQGWPETHQPISPKLWREHILGQHFYGVSGTQFEVETEYEVAKIIRATAANPVVTLPHYRDPAVENDHKVIASRIYVVSRSIGNPPFEVLTSYPLGTKGPTIDIWSQWLSSSSQQISMI